MLNNKLSQMCGRLYFQIFLLSIGLFRVVKALNTNRQTQNCNSELLKILMILNLVIVVSLLLRKIKKSVYFQGQPFSNMVKLKLFLGRYKILSFIRSNQNSQEHPFVQTDRRTVIGECYSKEKLDMGCVRNWMG